jgi:Ser/Thr protein kinase RdoA (MazF antagonist)
VTDISSAEPAGTRAAPEWVQWAAGVLALDPVEVTALRPDGRGPWRIDGYPIGGGSNRSAVLQADSHDQRSLRHEHEALSVLAARGLRVPQCLGWRDDPAVSLQLIQWFSASSHVPRKPNETRLFRFGEEIARIHAVAAPTGWPVRRRPIENEDFAALLRDDPYPLLEQGAAALARAELQPSAEGVVHGDLWHGQTLWEGDDLVAIIDWDHAGRGPAGIDLGAVRFDAALFWGEHTEDIVLAGWESAAGVTASDVAYWDLAAAVASPPDMGWFVSTMVNDCGRPDLDRPTLIRRRDDFLLDALGRLEAAGRG